MSNSYSSNRSGDEHLAPGSDDETAFASQDDSSSSFASAKDDFGLKPRPRAQRVDPLLGADLGGITITRLLGEGGMGRVYEARQHNPQRTVAVKVMRQGIASDRTARRFEREAEFLARLQHPGIAQVYVVGSYSSDEGDVPFFVMEFVENAKHINKFAAEHKLSLTDRLRLFVSVCDAVAHGHARGIIHRDLKPGNILIDGNGRSRVIDFGVARKADSNLTLTSLRTESGHFVGTFQYMSPEQFGANPDDLDSGADVYSLGVVLYELLAGSLPYSVQGKGIHEMARLVCEQPPAPLRSHDKRIPRDVAAIVDKCLEKSRRDRYHSAGELADDIRRFLDGQKVEASRRTFFQPRSLRRLMPTSRSGQAVLLLLAGAAIAGLATVVVSQIPGASSPADVAATNTSRDAVEKLPKPPAVPVTKEVFVTHAWGATGLSVEKDRCYRLTVVGQCKDQAGATFGPEGTCPAMLRTVIGPLRSLPADTRAQGYVGQHPRRAVIARIADKSWSINVGPGLTFIAPDSGPLSLRINEPETSTLKPEGVLTCTLEPVTQPQFVNPDRTTTIWAHVDNLDTLLISAQGLKWEYGGKWARVGLHEGVFPTLINGIAWWPMWTDPVTSDVLPTSDFAAVAKAVASGGPGLRVLDVTARHGQVSLQKTDGNVARLRFQDFGLGSADIGCTIELPGADTNAESRMPPIRPSSFSQPRGERDGVTAHTPTDYKCGIACALLTSQTPHADMSAVWNETEFFSCGLPRGGLLVVGNPALAHGAIAMNYASEVHLDVAGDGGRQTLGH